MPKPTTTTRAPVEPVDLAAEYLNTLYTHYSARIATACPDGSQDPIQQQTAIALVREQRDAFRRLESLVRQYLGMINQDLAGRVSEQEFVVNSEDRN